MPIFPFIPSWYVLKEYENIVGINGTPIKLEFESKKGETTMESLDVTRYREIQEELLDLYRKKNADYGDSFYETYSKFGLASTCIRLHDKLKRLESLSKKDGVGEVKDESVDDTLRDIANYAIMTLIARSQKEL